MPTVLPFNSLVPTPHPFLSFMAFNEARTSTEISTRRSIWTYFRPLEHVRQSLNGCQAKASWRLGKFQVEISVPS